MINLVLADVASTRHLHVKNEDSQWVSDAFILPYQMVYVQANPGSAMNLSLVGFFILGAFALELVALDCLRSFGNLCEFIKIVFYAFKSCSLDALR